MAFFFHLQRDCSEILLFIGERGKDAFVSKLIKIALYIVKNPPAMLFSSPNQHLSHPFGHAIATQQGLIRVYVRQVFYFTKDTNHAIVR